MTESFAPLIRTERLTLRAHRADDFEASFAMWSDPRVTRFIGGVPSTYQQSWSRVLTFAGLWSILGYGYWVIEETQTKRFVGEVGFADFKRDIVPSMRDVPEVGYALAPDAHGKGYATEALQAALAWGDEHLTSHRTVCMIAPENAPSIRVAEKCGYGIFERGTFAGNPALFLERVLLPIL
jgi:RimJ/RimL family protein N-acetyltransferase